MVPLGPSVKVVFVASFTRDGRETTSISSRDLRETISCCFVELWIVLDPEKQNELFNEALSEEFLFIGFVVIILVCPGFMKRSRKLFFF